MASIQFIRLLSSLIGSSIESWRGRRDGDHSRENIGGVILLVVILIPRIYRMKIIKIGRADLEGISLYDKPWFLKGFISIKVFNLVDKPWVEYIKALRNVTICYDRKDALFE